MKKLRIFVSSVQQELENERVAVAELVSGDAFLSRHCEAILFEQQPASSLPAEQAYLAALETCDVYVGIMGFEYRPSGRDGLSAMHREYLRAEQRGMPMFIFVKGQSGRDKDREEGVQRLFAAVRDPKKGHTYRRFSNYQDLKERVRESLLPVLAERGQSPTSSEQIEFVQSLSAASDFDSQLLDHVDDTSLDRELTSRYTAAVLGRDVDTIGADEALKELLNRGLLWHDKETGAFRPTSAALLLFGKTPDAAYPQCRIAAKAYGGTEKGEPIDRSDIRLALPRAVEEAFGFLVRNMRHTNTVVGFSRFQIDEYPYEALREASINAVAHRDYSLGGSSIRVEKYSDRIVILSPGLPPPPLTIEKIAGLRYLPCSRNPNIARGLSFFERIEEQGDGIRRMIAVTANMGLPAPEFSLSDGHFCVVFGGPGKSLAKLKPQRARPIYEVEPNVIDVLSDKQRRIVKHLLRDLKVDVPTLAKKLKVSAQAVRKDMASLQEAGLVEKRGAARATYYVLRMPGERS